VVVAEVPAAVPSQGSNATSATIPAEKK